jgi:autotransporter-associated beta strand protein
LAGGGPSALVETLTGVAEIASPIVLRNNASFDVAAEAELTISGPITELGSPKWLEKTGEGTLVLANSVAYGDMTFIDGGTLVFAGGIASGGTNFLSVRAGKAELTTTNINKASLLVYTSFGAEFEISGGNHSIGGIFGIGTTKVLAGTLYARSIVQDTLIIGTDEDASAANAVSVPEPNGLPLMIFAALALALRTILVRAKN